MPYNTSRNAVIRMKPYLDDMFRAQKTITWPIRQSQSSEKVARQLREAMYAVHYNRPEFDHFRDLKAFYEIRDRDDYIEAFWRGPTDGKEMREVTSPQAKEFSDVRDLQSVIGACIKYAPRHDELTFPDAQLSEDEMKILYKWARNRKEDWGLIDQQEAGITVTRRNVNAFLLWIPDERMG